MIEPPYYCTNNTFGLNSLVYQQRPLQSSRRRNVTKESAITSYVQGTDSTNQFCVWPTSGWDHDQRVLTMTVMEKKSDDELAVLSEQENNAKNSRTQF